ncbi:uroporphyrinogen decarboxylase family protein [Muricomes intestini]|jgi:uroporphyrinogen-III decarboxylase|uniref:Uroporphyrinogen decarboxylase n=1 Tax=Muricomes intestini TaxID=1796634 RepID=A0A4R3K5R8_9FIRM|nr:uroporphyrinogen decarboxylase family protein [Muricomes intestini]TCS78067.1 uroporphyrinogen decarboxylase [Muricomes intestini]
MGEIKDFHCTYDDSVGIDKGLMEKLGLKIPDVYMYRDMMVSLSRALKEKNGAPFCELPFCHTVEAEAMGGIIKYGDEKAGPRAKEYICTSVEQILDLPEIDFSKGRVYEVLLACQELKSQGEHVVLDVSGPFTILNVLIDIKYVVKAMRKQPEVMKRVFWKLGGEVLKFIEESGKYGVDIISYADSSGSVNILGPKMSKQVVEDFTYDFLKEVEKAVEGNQLVLLCPKTTFALLGTERAVFEDQKLPAPINYGEACTKMIGKVTFAGQMCIKEAMHPLRDGMFKAVVLQ